MRCNYCGARVLSWNFRRHVKLIHPEKQEEAATTKPSRFSGIKSKIRRGKPPPEAESPEEEEKPAETDQ